MGHDFELERTALFALGALNEADSVEAEAHLAICGPCTAEFAKLHAASGTLGLAVEAGGEHDLRIARAKKRVMSSLLPRHRFEGRSISSDSWYRAIAAAAVVLAIASAAWTLQLQRELYETRLALGERSREVQAATSAAAKSQTRLAVFMAPQTQHYDVSAGMVLRYDGKIYLALNRLPVLQLHHAFQAWTLAPGTSSVRPSITFVPNTRGAAFVALPESAASVQGIGVSVEPRGGSTKPTTKPIFFRTLI